MAITYKKIFKTDTLSLVQAMKDGQPCFKGDKGGFWLYDQTQGMNIGFRAESEHAAVIEALEYYQEKTQRLESERNTLKSLMSNFVESIPDDLKGDLIQYRDDC